LATADTRDFSLQLFVWLRTFADVRASLRIILFVLVVSGICSGAQPSVNVTVLNTNPRFRAGAPGNLQVQVENTTSGLRDGILETTVVANDTVVLSHETLLAIAPGKIRRTLFIPLLNTRTADMRVSFRFLADGKSQDAGTHLFPSGFGRDNLVLYAVDGKPNEDQNRLSRALRPERIAQEKNLGMRYVTNTEWLPPEELPANPLAYMAYDLVVLDHRALVSAKEKSLAALNRWVDAGGSVFVSPEKGTPLPDSAEKFLARLAIDDPVSDGTRWLAPGLGRAVIWRDAAPSDGAADAAWDRATGFLWRANLAQRSDDDDGDLGEIERTIRSTLGSDVQPLSFGTVAGYFVLFIFLTAAFDYFVLGRRFRKYTWGIFPLQCAAFAWLMMFAANTRLGTMQRSASVVITDLGIDGRVLRETKFVGFLPGKTSAADYVAEGAYVWPLDAGDMNSEQSQKPRYMGNSMRVIREKWTPCFVRETSMPEARETSGLHWERWRTDSPDETAPLVAAGFVGVDCAGRLPDSPPTSDKRDRWNRRWRPTVTPASFIMESNSWNGSVFSQFAPMGGQEKKDLRFPVDGTNRAILVAVKTDGNVTRVFRKLYRMEGTPR
jgi:hypothetical protein